MVEDVENFSHEVLFYFPLKVDKASFVFTPGMHDTAYTLLESELYRAS